MDKKEKWQDKLESINEGVTFVIYNKRKFSLSKKLFNKGKSMKVFAEELGGNDFFSANYYLTQKGGVLKPCEMPSEKVIDFLTNFKLIN